MWKSYWNRKRYVNDYILENTIGVGKFGRVKLARHKTTGDIVALKLLDKANDILQPIIKSFSNEVHALTILQHPNIVHVYFVLDDYNYPRRLFGCMHAAIIGMEVAIGDLHDYIYKKAFSNELALCVFKQLIDALNYCHKHGIYHRDVKPSNILISKDYNILLADFGLSSFSLHCTTNCGTLYYMAPEISFKNCSHYNAVKADLWSAGMCLFQMIVAKYEVIYTKEYSLIINNKWQELWKLFPQISPTVQTILMMVLSKEPSSRKSANDIFLAIGNDFDNTNELMREYLNYPF